MSPTAICYATRIHGVWRRWVLWRDDAGRSEWRQGGDHG